MPQATVPDSTDWTPRQRAELVVRILRRELTLEEAARSHSLPSDQIEDWQRCFLAGESPWDPRSRPRKGESARRSGVLPSLSDPSHRVG